MKTKSKFFFAWLSLIGIPTCMKSMDGAKPHPIEETEYRPQPYPLKRPENLPKNLPFNEFLEQIEAYRKNSTESQTASPHSPKTIPSQEAIASTALYHPEISQREEGDNLDQKERNAISKITEENHSSRPIPTAPPRRLDDLLLLYTKQAKDISLFMEQYLESNDPRWNELPKSFRIDLLKNFYKSTVKKKEAYRLDLTRTVLNVIQELAPELYEEIIAVDSLGTNHIHIVGDGAQFDPNKNRCDISVAEDGLPYITISANFVDSPDEILRFMIGHELGHYAHEDMFDLPKLKLKNISLDHFGSQSREFQKKDGKTLKITGKLSPMEVLKNRHSQQKEFAADAYAASHPIVSLKHKYILLLLHKALKNQAKDLFTTTHPLVSRTLQESTNEELQRDIAATGRIAHIQSVAARAKQLRSEGKQLPPIDWRRIIENYRKEKSNYRGLQPIPKPRSIPIVPPVTKPLTDLPTPTQP